MLNLYSTVLGPIAPRVLHILKEPLIAAATSTTAMSPILPIKAKAYRCCTCATKKSYITGQSLQRIPFRDEHWLVNKEWDKRDVQTIRVLSKTARLAILRDSEAHRFDNRDDTREPPYMALSADPNDYSKVSVIHWGQGLVYPAGTLQVHCKEMDKVPTKNPSSTLQTHSEFPKPISLQCSQCKKCPVHPQCSRSCDCSVPIR